MPYNEFQKIVDEIVQSDIVVLEEYSTENGYDENFDVTDIHITGSRKHYFTRVRDKFCSKERELV